MRVRMLLALRGSWVGLGQLVAALVLETGVNEDCARFAREQQAMVRLMGHPDIVAVLQVGQTAGVSVFGDALLLVGVLAGADRAVGGVGRL